MTQSKNISRILAPCEEKWPQYPTRSLDSSQNISSVGLATCWSYILLWNMRMFEGMVSHCGDPIASPLSPSDTKGAGNGHFSAASNRNTNVYYGGSCWLLKEPPFRPIVNIIFHFLRVDHCCSFFSFFFFFQFHPRRSENEKNKS